MLQANRKSTARRTTLQEEPDFEKERETKDDGRYIIFYAFEGEEAGES